jgi:hypothetical protein
MLMILKKGRGENSGKNSTLEKFKENVDFFGNKKYLLDT